MDWTIQPLKRGGWVGVIASAVLLRGGEANFPDVLSLLFMFGPAVVPGGVLFGLLLATVLLSRSTASGARWLSCSRWLSLCEPPGRSEHGPGERSEPGHWRGVGGSGRRGVSAAGGGGGDETRQLVHREPDPVEPCHHRGQFLGWRGGARRLCRPQHPCSADGCE